MPSRVGERALGDRGLLLERLEQLQIAAGFDVHRAAGRGAGEGTSGPSVTGLGRGAPGRSCRERVVHRMNGSFTD